VTLLKQSEIQHRVVLPWENNKTIEVAAPSVTKEFPRDQPSYETKDPVDLKKYGPTTRGPLGWIVGGRSGDKASDANVCLASMVLYSQHTDSAFQVGFYVRNDDEWDWLRSILTVDKIKFLLEDEYKDGLIERFEIPGIRAGE
jgi:hypothetical protein